MVERTSSSDQEQQRGSNGPLADRGRDYVFASGSEKAAAATQEAEATARRIAGTRVTEIAQTLALGIQQAGQLVAGHGPSDNE